MTARRLLPYLLPIAIGWLATGCDDDDHELGDYTPPAGKGTLTVDNQTVTDIEVYVDGIPLPRVNDGKFRRYDLEPGTHRLVLADDEDEIRSHAMDLDILQGRQTILDVTTDSDLLRRRFDVQAFID
jgi:hypothetical protein